jgi:chromate transporter
VDTALPDAPPALPAPSQPVSFAEALRFWLELGFISFGGPAIMMPLLGACAAIGLAVSLLLPQLR